MEERTLEPTKASPLGGLFSRLSALRQKGFFNLLSVFLLSQVLGFLGALFLSKLLGPEQFGGYQIMQSYAATFSMLSGLGLGTAVLKICSEARPAGEREAVMRRALHFSVLGAGVGMCVMAGLALGEVLSPRRELDHWLAVFSLAIPCTVLNSLFVGYLQAQKRVRTMATLEGVNRVLAFTGMIACTWMWGLPGLIAAALVASVLYTIQLAMASSVPILGHDRALPANVDSFLRMAFLSLLANGVNLLATYGDLYILDHFCDDRAAIGYYTLANLFLAAANQVPITAQALTMPYLSEVSLNPTQFWARLRNWQLALALASPIVACLVYGFAWSLVAFYFGPSYGLFLVFLAPLLVRFVIYASCALLGSGFVAMGRVHVNLGVVVVVAPLQLLLSYVLLQSHGVLGVAWAQAAGMMVTFTLTMILAWYIRRATA